MSKYNPAKDMPRNLAEWNTLIDFYLAKEEGKEQPLTRAEIEQQFACYYPQPEPESMPEPSFAEKKQMKLAELKAAFERASETAVVTTPMGWPADANRTAYEDVGGLIKTMTASNLDSSEFCDADNVEQQITLEEAKALEIQIARNGQILYARKWELRSAIEAAENEAALNAIVISFN